MTKETQPLKFETAFHYPFNRAKGMLNIFWLLVPIIGWFALGGYGVRLTQRWIKGEYKELPVFNFKDHLKVGFFMFLKSLPFIIVFMIVQTLLGFIPFAGMLANLFIGIVIIPILSVNFLKHETVAAYFEFEKVKYVFENFGDYIIAVLKSIALGIIFLLMIIILVGIPAGQFTQNIFLADFYRRRVK